MPGGRSHHHSPPLIAPFANASSMIVPHDTVPGHRDPGSRASSPTGSPTRPRAPCSPEMTGTRFGSTWRVARCHSPAPIARDRSTNGLCFTLSVCARTSRAVDAQDVMPMTMIDVQHRRAQDRGERDRERDPGDDQEPVRDRVQHPVRAPADVAAGHAHGGPDRGGDRRGRQADQQRHPGAPDRERQHRPPVEIGAQRVRPARRRQDGPVGERDLRPLVIGQQRGNRAPRVPARSGSSARPGPCGSCGSDPRSPGARATAGALAAARAVRVASGRELFGAHLTRSARAGRCSRRTGRPAG